MHAQAADPERAGEVQLQDHPQARPGEPAVPDARGPVRPQPDRHRAVHAQDRHRRRRGGAVREPRLLQGPLAHRQVHRQAVRRPEHHGPGTDVQRRRHDRAGQPAQPAGGPGRQAFRAAALQRAVVLVLRLQRAQPSARGPARARGDRGRGQPPGDAQLVLQRPGHGHFRPVRARQLGVQPRRQAAAVQPRARALLAEAGFRPGADGIMEKDGKKLALSLKVPIEKESEAVKRVVLAFQNYLKSVGIAITVEFKEWQAWKEDVFLEHNFDIMFASWVFDDSADISSLFHSAEIGSWKNNFGGYSNPEVDGLIVEAKLTLDHEKRRTINRKLHAILAEEQPYAFLWTLTNYSAYHRKLRRVQIHPYKFFSFADEWFIPASEQK